MPAQERRLWRLWRVRENLLINASRGPQTKLFLGVREGIELEYYAETDQEILRVSKALEDEFALIEAAAQKLEAMGQ